MLLIKIDECYNILVRGWNVKILLISHIAGADGISPIISLIYEGVIIENES